MCIRDRAHADVFFSLKSTNPEVKIPRGTELKTAVIAGNMALLDEIGRGIAEPDARTATADLLLDLLNRSKDRFLQRTIASALRFYAIPDFFSPDDKGRLADAVTSNLRYRDTIGILSQASDQVLLCAQDAGKERLEAILNRFVLAISKLDATSPPANLNTIVSDLYGYPSVRKSLAYQINHKCQVSWCQKREGLEFIDKIKIPEGLPEDEIIPSEAVVKTISSIISTQPPELDNNIIRRNIVFARWKDEYAQQWVNVFTAILQQPQSTTTYTPEIEFVISSFLLKNELPESPATVPLWAFFPALYNRLTDAKGKIEITKAIIIYALKSADAATRQAAKIFVKDIWKSLSDPALRESLKFSESIVSPDTQQLVTDALQQEFNSINTEFQAPTDRTTQRLALCLDYPEKLQPNAIEDLLVKSLDVGSEEALKTWLSVIEGHQKRLTDDFTGKLVSRCLELVPVHSARPKRQAMLLETIARNLSQLTPEAKKIVLQKYFSLLKDANPGTRDTAAGALGSIRSAVSDIQELRISVANALGDLRREIVTQQLPQYRGVFDALLQQGDLFGEYQWKDVADLSKRLMSQSDASLQDMGISLVERMAVVPKDDQEAVVHLLVGFATSTSPYQERSKRELERLSILDLVESARTEIEKWRSGSRSG